MTEVLRLGARRLLAQAVEMEVMAFVEGHAYLTDGAAVDRRSSGPSVRPPDHEASLDEIERIVILGKEPRPDAAILRSRYPRPAP